MTAALRMPQKSRPAFGIVICWRCNISKLINSHVSNSEIFLTIVVIQGVSHRWVKYLTARYLTKKGVSGVSLFHETLETPGTVTL
jgi:hypothetical protein